jgi:type IV pilus assembly protein PilY1
MPIHRIRLTFQLSALSALLLAGPASSVTDISNRPLITNQVSVKPNLMFILDNSGSMAWEFIPNAISSANAVGFYSPQCNGAAYNPSTTYPLPVTPDGREYPSASLSAAWEDGFNPEFATSLYPVSTAVNSVVPATGSQVSVVVNDWPSGWLAPPAPFAANDRVALRRSGNSSQWISATVASISGSGTTRTVVLNLVFSSLHTGSHTDWQIGRLTVNNLTGSGFQFNKIHRYKGSQPAMSWTYNSSGDLISTTFTTECLATSSSSVFDVVLVSSFSNSQKQNYANWYSYYRTRIAMMRSSAGRAMSNLDTSYRVGFSTLNRPSGDNTTFNNLVTDTARVFTNIRDFDATQRLTFYSNLYGTTIAGGTPLRRALVKAGRYYANDISGQTDPVQHACQRNYTLLTSDGYWNDSDYTPARPTVLGGGSIGNQDGDVSDATWTPRPVYDGSGDSARVEQRLRYVNLGTCVVSRQTRTLFQAITERRSVTTQAVDNQSQTVESPWVTTAEQTNCGTIPSPNPSSTTVLSSTTHGQSNTLADIAAYYYKTDLRPNLSNSVFTSPADPASHQHMTTYTLGLGLSGVLQYDPNYLDQTTGDFVSLKNGTINWPTMNFNVESSPGKVDDLWHAAVNGRGRYFSASDPQALTDSLSSALSDINAREGVGAAAASSTLRPVLGTDQIFLGSYRTRFWDGELEARTITRLSNGQLSAGPNNKVWSASAQLNATPFASRNIFYLRRQATTTGVTNSLAAFTWANINSDADASALLNHFNRFCEQGTIPSQCPTLTTEQKTAAKGENLLNFLRGDRSREGSLYRTRESVLGDIVDASPVFVGPPPFNYTAQDYSSYKTAKANRCPMVYVAANDGMLHAFSAKTNRAEYSSCPAAGSEAWAYVPRAMMSNMYLLADRDYANNHRFYVNSTPVVGDIGETTQSQDGTETTTWKTILVGGFGAGGRGYYALDITTPQSPAALWEFTDADMGLSYGNPIITQIADGEGNPTWVVAFTSGLNNSGNGFLYVVNARTGALMHKVPTLINGGAVGTASSPSGLNKLNAWVESPTFNLTRRFYAGDMRGNLWRFDASNLAAPAANTPDTRAVRLANLAVSGVAQPITIRPELAQVNYGGYQHPVVLVGTGRYLGISDVETDALQSIYAIKDPLTSTGWGNVRPNLIEQTLSAYNDSANVRTLTKRQVDWNSSTVAGWYIDLPDDGERVVTNMGLAFTTLTVASLVPKADVCSGDGYSWLYNLDIGTGSYVNEGPVAGEKSDQAVMGISIVQVVDGDRNETVGLNTKSTGETSFNRLPDGVGGSAGLRRTSWRELLPPGQ